MSDRCQITFALPSISAVRGICGKSLVLLSRVIVICVAVSTLVPIYSSGGAELCR